MRVLLIVMNFVRLLSFVNPFLNYAFSRSLRLPKIFVEIVPIFEKK